MKAEITPLPLPLPWKLQGYFVVSGEPLQTENGKIFTTVCGMHGMMDKAQATANAEYIVRCANAHPELVKALEAARADSVLYDGSKFVRDQIESALALAGRATQGDGKEK